MSSSLFSDFYTSYEIYPKTEYVEGDKKFGDLKVGDKLYLIDVLSLTTLIVTKELHKHNGKTYLSCITEGNRKEKKNLCFGPNDSANVLMSGNQSILYYGDEARIGTNLESVKKIYSNYLMEKIEKTNSKLAFLTKKLEFAKTIK